MPHRAIKLSNFQESTHLECKLQNGMFLDPSTMKLIRTSRMSLPRIHSTSRTTERLGELSSLPTSECVLEQWTPLDLEYAKTLAVSIRARSEARAGRQQRQSRIAGAFAPRRAAAL